MQLSGFVFLRQPSNTSDRRLLKGTQQEVVLRGLVRRYNHFQGWLPLPPKGMALVNTCQPWNLLCSRKVWDMAAQSITVDRQDDSDTRTAINRTQERVSGDAHPRDFQGSSSGSSFNRHTVYSRTIFFLVLGRL